MNELSVTLYNPLPRALAHYELALTATLREAGVDSIESASAPSAELRGCSWPERGRRIVLAATGPSRTSAPAALVIACWPTFGLLDPLLWALRRAQGRVALIVHDPTPLRRQPGLGRTAARLGALGLRRGNVDVVVHSQPARDALLSMGWPEPHVLPHPILDLEGMVPDPSRAAETDPATVSICGQHKPARDLSLVTALGPVLAAQGMAPEIAGRGWPAIPGWRVNDEFLSEEALDRQISRSSCVVIPYRRFFQSGIAVRALELGRPVVGPRHPFLEDLFGADWPGLTDSSDPADWAGAVERSTGVPSSALATARHVYANGARDAWRHFVGAGLPSLA